VLTSGATTLSSFGSSQAVTFSNIAALTGAEMAYGSSNLTMTYTASVVAGANDAQSLTLSGQTGGTFAAGGIETVNVTVSGAAVGTSITAPVTIDNTNTVKTLNISGDQTTWLALTDNSATVVDASKATGRIGVDISASVANKDVSITGGTANDTFTVGTLGTADSLDGGTGTDTVVVNASTGTTALTNVKNVETVELRINATTSTADVDASVISGVTAHRAVLTDSANGGGDVDVTFSKFSDTGSLTVAGSTATGAAAPTNTITVTHATNTATNVFNVTLAGIGNAATTGLENLKADNAETINLTVGANSTGTVTANYIGTLESSNATTLTLTGDNTLQVGALSAANLKTVNASAMTKGLVLTDGGAVARTITLGSAADLLIAGSAADTITSGDGNDVIVSGGGNDVINGGAGNDTIHVGTVAAPAVGSTAATAVSPTYSTSEQRASISGGDGNDSIVIDNTALTFRTTVVGGDGTDTLTIRSAANGTTTIAADGGTTTQFLNISGVENIRLREVDAGNDNLILTINDSALTTTFAGSVSIQAQGDAAGDVVRVDASGVLGASGTIRMSAATDNVGILEMIGGASTDVFTGGTLADTVTYNNAIYLTGTDTLAGGSGSDVLIISSANAAVVSASQLAGATSFENINLDGGAGAAATAMRLTLTEAVAAANAESSTNLLTVNRAQTGGTIDDTGTTRVDASALTATNVALTGALGADTLTGGAGNDVLTGGTGIDSLTGGAGNDRFQYSAATDITVGEVISGGDGTDTIRVSGTTDNVALDFSGATITSIEVLDLIHDAATGGAVATATFNAASLSATTLITESTATDDETTVVINTAAGTNDFSGFTFGSTRATGISATNAGSNASLSVNITGTTLADALTGGTNADTITGGLGIDVITGGQGSDVIVLSESTSSADVVVYTGTISSAALGYDTLIGVTLGTDVLRFTGANIGNGDTTLTVTNAAAASAAALSELNVFTTALANDAAVVTAIRTVTSTTPTLYLIFNTADNAAQVWYDADSNTDGGETELISLAGITSAQLAAFTATATNFVVLV
jgi:trimeric autotransporter adhesin